jgi:predicted MFS family arabinose efflux permease
MDASLPYILVEAVKADLNLTDTQIGLVTGPAFSLTYAICALPIAKISDRYIRKRVICTAIVVWSGLTAAAGLAQGFATFALTRVGVALGESALTPAANSIIADNTTPTTRPIALAVYTLGVPIGGILALVLGGWISDNYGWRTAFFLIGGSGLFLTLLVGFTVREPVRRRDKASFGVSKGDIRSLFKHAALRNILVGGALTGMSVSPLHAWGPAYTMRTFGLSATETGASFGPSIGVAAIIGMVAGGFVASSFAAERPGHTFRLLAILLVVGTAAQIASLLVSSYALFLLLIALTSFCVTFYTAPVLATIQSLVDPRARSFAAAVAMFCISGIGLASGAFLTGLLSDLLRSSVAGESLRWALLILTMIRLWAAAHFFVVANALDRLKAA